MLINIRTIIAVAFLSMLLTVPSFAQESRESLFSDAVNAFDAANAANANVFSPKNYSKGVSAYNSASERFDKKQKQERIRKDLDKAIAYFQQAIDATLIADVSLASEIRARNDAIKANAKSYAKEEWAKAEKLFNDAARRLEAGNLKSAQAKGKDAEKLYRQSELIAIKANYLTETRTLINTARQNKADKYAPQTLANAESLLAQAEKGLTENRYDTDQPKALAREAKYEAQHANYIAVKVAPIATKKTTVEALILEMEKPIISIASSLDIVASLDGTSDAVSQPLVDEIEKLKKAANELPQRKQDIVVLEEELAKLESRLGIQSQRLEKQEEKRQRIESVKRMFLPSEAIVFEQDNNLLIRMTGLKFRSGKADVDIEYFDMLNKVLRALNIFPQSQVTIEGHTDSFGSDETNMELSRERAVAVRTYITLTNVVDRAASSIVSQGFGETRPISTNDSAEGREKNRRIDIVIKL